MLEEDDREKEQRMVTFLISKLISGQLHDGESNALGEAFLALSHLDFLHHCEYFIHQHVRRTYKLSLVPYFDAAFISFVATSTRDLLLPQAPELLESLGIQMDVIASGWIPPFDYSSERANRFILATVGLALNVSKHLLFFTLKNKNFCLILFRR